MINLISRQPSLNCKRINNNNSNIFSSGNCGNLAPLKVDTTSFTSFRRVDFSTLSNDNFPFQMYFNEAKILNKLSKHTGKEIMQQLPMEIGDLMAKRMEFLGKFSGFAERIKCGAFSFALTENGPKYFKLHDIVQKKDGGKSMERQFRLDWTKQYDLIMKNLDTPEKLTEEAKTQLLQTLTDLNLIKMSK